MGMDLPSCGYLRDHCDHSPPLVVIFSGTNCPANAAKDRSVFNRFSSDTQPGHVSLPAIARIGRPVCCDNARAASMDDAAPCPQAAAALPKATAIATVKRAGVRNRLRRDVVRVLRLMLIVNLA